MIQAVEAWLSRRGGRAIDLRLALFRTVPAFDLHVLAFEDRRRTEERFEFGAQAKGDVADIVPARRNNGHGDHAIVALSRLSARFALSEALSRR
jgi:hypothetical protein